MKNGSSRLWFSSVGKGGKRARAYSMIMTKESEASL